MSEELLYRIRAKLRIIAAKTRLHTLEPDMALQAALIMSEIKMNEEFLDIVESHFLRRKANFQPDQPRVSAGNPDGGQWTDAGGSSSTLTQPVYMRREDPFFNPWALGGGGAGTGAGALMAPFLLREGGRSTGLLPAEDAVAEYNRLTNQRDPTVKPVLLFRPKDWGPDDQLQPGKRVKATVQILNKNEVKQYCPEIGIVQSLANQAVKQAGPRSNYEKPWLFGTAAHTNLKNLATANYPSILTPEQSFLKFAEEVAGDERPDLLAKYGMKNTVRIDILGPERDNRVCVYDFKTGRAGISVPRAIEMRNAVYKIHNTLTDVIIVEINFDESWK
ncbi:hypothetical protein [Phyllobacterium lublinensis]|uniref:hypothetical protein n=1 Tax=Phyllobacterium lublinensis TaxID=2875708 RepID=UPI001CCE1552|nr:hypothetical protein [Phyllobacterium sp. 2063]MBZ9654361.1 hypothetical protein [Phyllobacterium sp. 2063]